MPLERPAVVITPLGDSMLLRRMSGVEELGRVFTIELDLLSTDTAIKASSLLGQPITVKLEVEGGGERCWNGIVTRFSRLGDVRRYAQYHVTLRPWLWLLSRNSDCRIFQNMTVPDVLKQVFRDFGMTDFDAALTGSYRSWDYLVQYRETTLNFVSRIMEQEGIYYFHKHEEGKHTLVLADSYSAHETRPHYDEVPYYPPDPHEVRERDHIESWSATEQIQPGVYTLDDYDFKRPKANLLAKSAGPRAHAHADMEYFDYPGEYVEVAEGEGIAKVRLQALDAQHEQLEGHGDARGLGAGGLFKLSGYPVDAQNREYLIVRSEYQLESERFETGTGGSGERSHFRAGVTAIESRTPFRVHEITPKPTIAGPQTAIIVGKAGEDIWTDEFGRVKVQFHWDRYGKSDENSSCWVRVAQYWAGGRWGSIHIPRLGQEVIIEFLEGDPDRPIITGRVYNGDNMPPYDLPANQTQSGWKSRSTKGGNPDNFNEIRFEDKKGSEQVYVQAEKNMDTLVKNNQTLTVGVSRNKSIGADETTTVGTTRTETVGTEETITIGANRTETVGANETITIAANRVETVGAAETITVVAAQTITVGGARALTIGGASSTTVAAGRTDSIGGGETVTIGAARGVTIGGADAVTISGARKLDVGGALSTTVGAKHALTVGAAESVDISGDRKHSVGGGDKLDVGKKLTITVADEITFKTGDASITMKKNGDIQLKGKAITINGSGKINLKADSDIVLKGSKIGQN